MKATLILVALFLSSCATSPERLQKMVDCSKTNEEVNARYKLFSPLSKKEIAARKKINITAYSSLNELSVFSKIVEAVLDAPKNSKMIAVDLRGYNDVDLGNIVISKIKTDDELEHVLKSSRYKYDQGFFALINFNSESVTIAPPLYHKFFAKSKISLRQDLNDVELVINVSDSGNVSGNMKFSPNQKVSILADRIFQPYRVDLRETDNYQFLFDDKWIMSVYSITDSQLCGGKKTTGLFKYVNNKNGTITNQKFDRSFAACYTDPSGDKF
jgi:hypothetical protein